MGFVLVIDVRVMIFNSLYDAKKGIKAKALEIDTKMFIVSNGFAVGTLIIGGVINFIENELSSSSVFEVHNFKAFLACCMIIYDLVILESALCFGRKC